MKKRLSLLLALLLLVAAVAVACSDPQSNPAESSSQTSKTLGDESSEAFYGSDLPVEHSLDGYEMTVYQKMPDLTAVSYTLFWDEEIGADNKIDESIYNRNMTVSDRYDFTVYTVYEANDVTPKLNALILANDDTYDVGLVSAKLFYRTLTADTYQDLNEIPYLDLSKPYWDGNYNEQVSLMDKSYSATGDILLTDDDSQMVMVWMKEVAEDFQIGDLYEVARNNAFTYDVVLESIRKVKTDFDNDGYSIGDDRMGMLYAFNNVTYPLLTAADCRLFSKNEESLPEIINDVNHLDDVVNSIQTLLLEEGNAFDWINGFGNGDALAQRAGVISIMNSGRVLFVMPLLSNVRRTYASVEADFGILPLPKYDEQQEDYRTMLYGDYQVVAVPATTKDTQSVGFILEALAAASGNITNSYYEVTLENRYLRDPLQDMEMLALARSSVWYDLANIYEWGAFGTQIDMLCLGNSRKNVASIYDSYADSSTAVMQSYLEALTQKE